MQLKKQNAIFGFEPPRKICIHTEHRRFERVYHLLCPSERDFYNDKVSDRLDYILDKELQIFGNNINFPENEFDPKLTVPKITETEIIFSRTYLSFSPSEKDYYKNNVSKRVDYLIQKIRGDKSTHL